MRARLVVVILGAAAGAALTGCDDSRGTGAVSSSEARSDCSTICQSEDACSGVETDVDACIQACADDIAGWERADASETVAHCIAGLDCADDEALCDDLVKPLAIHRTWSQKCSMLLAVCDGVDPASCAVDGVDGEDSLTRFIAEPIMKKLVACLDLADCAARLECTQTELAMFDQMLRARAATTSSRRRRSIASGRGSVRRGPIG